MEWAIVLIVVVCGALAYFLFSKNSFPTDPQDYANKARTDPVNSSFAGSRIEQFYANNALKTVEARRQLAVALDELHKTEGAARVAKAENDLAVTRHKLAHELEVFQHNYQATTLQASEQLTKKAVEAGMTLEIYQQVKVEEGKAQVEVLKHQQMTDIDLEKRWKEIIQDNDSIDWIELTGHKLIEKLTNHLFTLMERRREIDLNEIDEWLKENKLTQIDRNIENIRELIYARQNRLLQAESGQEERRALPEADS